MQAMEEQYRSQNVFMSSHLFNAGNSRGKFIGRFFISFYLFDVEKAEELFIVCFMSSCGEKPRNLVK
jgi:hypothetical protein